VAELDGSAFSAFHATHARQLWVYVYRVTGDGADADDIVQEAFLRLLRSGPAAGDEARRRFLYRVASNLMVDRWRRRKREDHHHSTSVPDVRVEARAPDDDVARTFAELSARDRALLWLAYVEGETHEQIAASLGVGTRSIKVLLFRAKRRLRALLQAKGVSRTSSR
jgi:RNA polymerase sigma-70 factor (ECF subfamily)